MQKLISQHIYIILGLILFLGFVLRFYALGNIPLGLTNDEVNIGYDAYSILQTGKDQWGESYPLINFKGFGDYRASLYTYLVVPFIPLFDLNAFSVRFPSAIFGVLSIFLIFIFARKLFNNNGIALLSALTLGISPWSIGLSRVGIESNVAIAFVLSAFISILSYKKNLGFVLLGILFLALSVYTYPAYLLFAPLAFLLFFVVYRKEFRKKYMSVVIFFILLALMLLPLFLKNGTASVRFSQTGILNNINSISVVSVLNSKRGACTIVFHDTVCRIFMNKSTEFSDQLVGNYFSHLSPSFLFFEGSNTQYSILYKRGLEYAFGVITIVLGMFFLLKERRSEGILLLGLFFLAPVPDSLTSNGHYSRSSIMIPFVVLVEAFGLFYLLKIIDSFKNRRLKPVLYISTVLIISFSLASFAVTYASYFKVNYSSYSQAEYRELMNDLKKDSKTYKEIYVSNHLNDAKQYIYYLFFSKYDPKIYQSKRNVKYFREEGGWIRVSQIDNINFIGRISEIEKDVLKKEDVLLIGHPTEFPDNVKSEGAVKDGIGSVKFLKVRSVNL